jgi:hypothetical protein
MLVDLNLNAGGLARPQTITGLPSPGRGWCPTNGESDNDPSHTIRLSVPLGQHNATTNGAGLSIPPRAMATVLGGFYPMDEGVVKLGLQWDK